MAVDNYINVIELAENKNKRIKFSLFLNKYPNENKEVPDPYFGLENGFEVVYTCLTKLATILLKINAKQY
jgi:protein-tyrosine phosphatase